MQRQRRAGMRWGLLVTVFEALGRDGWPKFNAHVIVIMPDADARDRLIESLHRSSVYSGRVDVRPVDDWSRLTAYLLKEATPAAWFGAGKSFRRIKGSIPLGDLGGDRVVLSLDLKAALIDVGRIEPYRRSYAKRLPKAPAVRQLGAFQGEWSMSDAADNIIIKRTRRPRPPRLPESIDGYGFVGRHDDASRAPTRIEQTVAPPLTESPGAPFVSNGGDDTESEAVPTVPLYQGGGEGKGNRPLQGINEDTTNQLIEHSEQGVSSKYSGTVGTVSQRDTFLKRISKLSELDEEGARAIIGDAIREGLSSLISDSLIKPLADALGVKESAIRKFWKEVDSQARATADSVKTTEDSTAEERARLEREVLEQRKREVEAERARLWRSCKDIAESPTLLADVEAVVHKLGVVGEGAAIRGAYLTASSRLNSTSAISLLRRGAASAGKNFLITKTLRLIPADSVIHMSSGSPLSLVYYGGGDEDALKHKVLYLAEAAILADRKASESPLAVMLRTLISEGRLDHNVALPQADGSPATKHVRRSGPVAVIITSARDNIEEEMLTRLMTSDADESREQTLGVLADVLSK